MTAPDPTTATDTGTDGAGRRILIRLTVPVLAVSLLLLTMGASASWYVHRLQRTTSDLLAQNIADIHAAEELVILLRQIGHLSDSYLLTGDRAPLDAALALRPEAEYWLGEAQRYASTERERALLADLETVHERFWRDFTEGLSRADRDEIARQAKARLNGEILPLAQAHLDLSEQIVLRSGERNRALSQRVALGLLLLGVCGSVAGLVAGFGIARGISRSIVQLSMPVRDAAGRMSEVVGPITLAASWDVEELDRALQKMAGQVGTIVERLEQSRREALHAEQLAALGQLAAGLAHELRNPLTAMKILVQSAVERDDPAGLHGRPLAVLDEEIRRLEGSIQTFLDFARPPRPEKRACDLTGLVERTMVLVASRAQLKAIATERSFPDGPIALIADAGQLRQLLLNLLLNAIDATPVGGQLRVCVALDGPEPAPGGPADTGKATGRWVAIRVADSGPGLPDQLGDRIFEPFVSTKETGLGLGLSICRRIVEAHGGRISATCRPEVGAEFTVYLPHAERAQDDAASPATTSEVPPTTGPG